MRVEYPAVINKKTVVFSEECATDTDAFEFVCHMDELYGDLTCRVGEKEDRKTSDYVKLQVRQNDNEDKFYEAVCYYGDLQWYKKRFGVKKKGDDNLFPQRKWGPKHSKAGDWLPNNGWVRYDDSSKEETA